MSKSRGSKERRAARRERDREWCEVRLVLLRVAYNYKPEMIDYLRKMYPTKGLLKSYLLAWPSTTPLGRDKLHETIKETRQA